ncbi:hypothetical protein EDD16DRAFT_1705049 [Pisolithus croceorrhizus]|nr:hypothetical protein F5141DRAFT_1297214 [Pisolithus sp. B1]KAI6122466.1 hypothetical protein EDD16DRAFT_1705049 [Pisolithus croceorrhizus]KAI6128842.1 hypothetical protein EV401DRAFT_2067175 [Pisolithus croceorrhizus]KAI6145320.1 hypothetical protein EDD17DRAFT_1767933 [Pisolithus thermaeus]
MTVLVLAKMGRGMRVERTVAHVAGSKIRSDPLVCTWEPKDKKAMVRGDFSELTLFSWEKYRAFKSENAPPETQPPFAKGLHRWAMDSLASAPTTETRTELIEMFLDVAQHCHEIQNYSASCLISLLVACARPSMLPFPLGIKISGKHDMIKATLSEFYTAGNNHVRAYKDALQNCHCAALPGMMLFIGEVACGCDSGPYEAHPLVLGSRAINLRRYHPITWAVGATESTL